MKLKLLKTSLYLKGLSEMYFVAMLSAIQGTVTCPARYYLPQPHETHGRTKKELLQYTLNRCSFLDHVCSCEPRKSSKM